jgi:membrane-associated phospholipid phosphatase
MIEPMIEPIMDGGVDLILWLQSLGSWIYAPMEVFTFMGTEESYLLIMPIIYWTVNASLGFRLGAILLLAGGVNIILKWALHLPRPYWYDACIQGMIPETSFGAPSSHSQVPSSVFGLIAATYRRTWIWGISIPLIFLIGLSRLVLGLHFYFDVVLGWALGGIGILLFLSLENRVKAWFERRNFASGIGAAFSVTVAMIIFGLFVQHHAEGFELPRIWIENAIVDQPGIERLDPFELESLISSMGALFGLSAGYILISSLGGFDSGGKLQKRAARVILGILGILILAQGLGSIFPRDPDLLSYSLRYLRYALVGFWAGALAPLLFIRLGLAERAKEKES